LWVLCRTDLQFSIYTRSYIINIPGRLLSGK
jgi:hypothetical protein